MVVGRAAEILDLQLPTQEAKTILLTEVLLPSLISSESLLPFNEPYKYSFGDLGNAQTARLPVVTALHLGTQTFLLNTRPLKV